MIADPDEAKVKSLLARLSKFHWSRLPPEQCVMPDGTGLGRVAYDDIAAFNVAWSYCSPRTHKEHETAIVATVQLKRVMDVYIGRIRLRDAIMLLKPQEFLQWLESNKAAIDSTLFDVLFKAAVNRHIH